MASGTSSLILFTLLPATGGFIGWLTNYLAIRSLFRPARPRRIGPIQFWGLIPKRQSELASSVGKIVEKELLTAEAISQRLQEGAIKERIIQEILDQMEEIIEEKVPSILRQTSKDLLMPVILKEVNRLLDKLLNKAEDFICEEAKIKDMVEEKIKEFEVTHLEKLVLEVAGKELKHIELLGGILGITIGLIQALLIT